MATEQIELQLLEKQIMANMIDAHTLVAIMGRSYGKSEIILAQRLARRVKQMPRSLGIIGGSTYMGILSNVLPALRRGWEKIGYIENVHYFIGKFAPKEWNWKRPYRCPTEPKYFIHWFTGAGQMLVSQDIKFNSNGIRSNYIEWDEAKTMNVKRFNEEVVPTNSGYRGDFPDCPQNHGYGFYCNRRSS